MNLLQGVSCMPRNISVRLTALFLRRGLSALIALLCLIATPALAKTYTDNGDGTVTDPTTGLIWMRCSMGQDWNGSTCTGTASPYTPDQANALTGTVTFAGKSDWRLPNIRELQSIAARSSYNPAIDAAAFPNTPASNFWSASDYAGSSDYAWGVYFGYGSAGSYYKNYDLQVRLVRAGQYFGLLDIARPTSDYVVQGDGTATHPPTGLMWKRCAESQSWDGNTCIGSGSPVTWDAAMLLTSTFAGHNDWRVPTEEELLTLVDYTNSALAMNASVFPNALASIFWSASAYAGDPTRAWGVSFGAGHASDSSKADVNQVRLVRLAKTYSNNGDGTVTDPTTGLTWMRCSMGQAWDGSTCTGTEITYKWDQANALTATTTFAGKSDWRLPNIRELQSIVARSSYNPAIDAVAFPNMPAVYSSYFWSASADVALSGYAWLVYFGHGGASNASKNNAFQVRLVRAGQYSGLLDIARPTSDYVVPGDGTATHTPTGLMWKRCAEGQDWDGNTCIGSGSPVTWNAAMLLTSTFAGRNDWRVPTEEELLTLVDYTNSAQAMNTSVFPNALALNFWSASTDAGDSASAWLVSFDDGYASNGNPKASDLHQVRLVTLAAEVLTTTTTTTTTTTAAVTTTTTTVADTTTTTLAGSAATLNLVKGWNLVGNGYDAPLDVATAFGNAVNVTTVWKWVVAKTSWAFYTPSLVGQALIDYTASKGYDPLTTISAGEGFWVNANQAFTAPLPSGASRDAISFQDGKPGALKQGWNLISIGNTRSPSEFNVDVGAVSPAAGVVPQNIVTLWAWDNNSLGKWYFYAPNLEARGGTALTDYITSKGYLDFTTASKPLGPGMGFWVNK